MTDPSRTMIILIIIEERNEVSIGRIVGGKFCLREIEENGDMDIRKTPGIFGK